MTRVSAMHDGHQVDALLVHFIARHLIRLAMGSLLES